MRIIAGVFCAGGLLFGPETSAQSLDEAHITPRVRSAAPVSPQGSDSTAGAAARLRIGVDLVLVPVSVTDGMSRPIMTLQKDNFTLYEGSEPQQIRYFSTEDSPISIGVLLDLSSSMKDKIDTARQALEEFFNNAHPEDDYFVIGFSDRPKLLADTTQSIESIEEKLELATPNGTTALLDAMYMGLTKLRNARYRRRALLIISDGGDNHSRYGAKEIRRLVQEADVEIYGMGIFDSGFFKTYEEYVGKKLLTDLSEATGGRTITLDKVEKLPEIAATVSRELRSQYVLGYRPKNELRDGKWRPIKVTLTPPSPVPMQVYCKRGYLAPEQ